MKKKNQKNVKEQEIYLPSPPRQQSPYFASHQSPTQSSVVTNQAQQNIPLQTFGNINPMMYNVSGVPDVSRTLIATNSSPKLALAPMQNSASLVTNPNGFNNSRAVNLQPVETKVTTTKITSIRSYNNLDVFEDGRPANQEKASLISGKVTVSKKKNKLILVSILASIAAICFLAGLVCVFLKMKKKPKVPSTPVFKNGYDLITNTTTVVTQSWDPKDTFPGVFISHYPDIVAKSSLENDSNAAGSKTYMQLLFPSVNSSSDNRKNDGIQKTVTYIYPSKRKLPKTADGSENPSMTRRISLSPIVLRDAAYIRDITPSPFSFKTTSMTRRPLKDDEIKRGKITP